MWCIVASCRTHILYRERPLWICKCSLIRLSFLFFVVSIKSLRMNVCQTEFHSQLVNLFLMCTLYTYQKHIPIHTRFSSTTTTRYVLCLCVLHIAQWEMHATGWCISMHCITWSTIRCMGMRTVRRTYISECELAIVLDKWNADPICHRNLLFSVSNHRSVAALAVHVCVCVSCAWVSLGGRCAVPSAALCFFFLPICLSSLQCRNCTNFFARSPLIIHIVPSQMDSIPTNCRIIRALNECSWVPK